MDGIWVEFNREWMEYRCNMDGIMDIDGIGNIVGILMEYGWDIDGTFMKH